MLIGGCAGQKEGRLFFEKSFRQKDPRWIECFIFPTAKKKKKQQIGGSDSFKADEFAR